MVEIAAGTRLGRLVVVDAAVRCGGRPGLLCKCDCGGTKVVDRYSASIGRIQSCGCLAAEHSRVAARVHGENSQTWSKVTAEYRTWCSMLRRCSDPIGHPSYAHVKVCDEWASSYQAFLSYIIANLGRRPPEMSIDRVDNEGDYKPGNVRWATRQQQARNTKTNVKITFRSKTRLLCEWAEELGFAHHTLKRRFDKGWSTERALTTPLGGA